VAWDWVNERGPANPELARALLDRDSRAQGINVFVADER